MAGDKQKKVKKSRKPKSSAGVNRGARRERAPMQLLIMMDKGPAHRQKPLHRRRM